ncbi:HTH-type transcriptional regulator BetI [wastewater metagenome]|uniref:HTH-type transcriptional regulator BetI n=2 Tax=unclassified sequences TaxID=12908 RepID=A0A5B8RJ24_9ZZZZ|nr:TetR/AcrR family transcriptional regulator [Arhodomonas sp. KWT]QEA07732.1 HTH-type transcriptional regulator BetI [uncultured organism]
MAPRVVDVEARQRAIAGAAVEVFARDGFQGALVDDIAAAAGLSKGSVYRYFDDKEALFRAAFEACQGALMAECQAAMAARDGHWDALAAGLLAAVAGLRRQVAIFPLTLEFWAAASAGPARERLGTIMRGMYAEFRALVAETVRAGQSAGELDAGVDPEAVAAWLVGGVDGVVLQHWFDPSVNPDHVVAGMLETVRRGLQPAGTRGDDGAA